MTLPRSHYAIALLCVSSGFAFWWSLNWGVGLSPDSMFYLKQSSGLAESFSISQLQDKAPPLYPVAQYITGLFVGDTFVAIKVLHALLYVVNTFVFAFLIFTITGRSGALALLAVVVHASSPAIYTIHSFALTEPLFVTFFLLTLLFVYKHFETQSMHWLVIAGCTVGLMILTRFAGISFLGSVALFLLLSARNRRFPRVLKQLSGFALAAVALPVGWALLKLMFDPDVSPPRTVQFHPVSVGQLLELLGVYAEWLFIGRSPVVFFMLLAIVAHLTYERLRAGQLLIPAFFVFTGFFYVGFILLSITFFDAYIPLDQRIMLPCLYLALLFVLEAIHSYLQGAKSWLYRIEVGVLAMALVVFGGAATLAAGAENYRQGRGFMSKSIQEIELHDVVKNVETQTVYTNAPELVQLHVGKMAILLPQVFDPSSRVPNDNLVRELSEILQAVDDGRAVIVYYNAVNWRTYLPSPDFFAEQYGLMPGYMTPDGAIFKAPLR